MDYKYEQFNKACKLGNLHEVKKIYLTGILNIHAYDYSGFRIACDNNRIDVAKWLQSRGADVHAINDQAFRYSCRSGHIDIAKWLYSLGGVDIHFSNDYAFRHSCFHGYIDIAKWLIGKGVVPNEDHELYEYYCNYYPMVYNLIILHIFVKHARTVCITGKMKIMV